MHRFFSRWRDSVAWLSSGGHTTHHPPRSWIMKLHTAWLAAAILTVASPALAQSGPANTGVLAVPANRIVGLWEATATVRPCNVPGAPARNVRNNLLFHAGGTVTENPGGLPSVAGSSRSFGLGTWRYDPDNERYTGNLRFDTYLDGVYSGYTTIDRDIGLEDADTAAGPVVVSVYDSNGNPLVQLCGTAIQHRL
jgi:hypothetical protein